jgi:hypothetical protein
MVPRPHNILATSNLFTKVSSHMWCLDWLGQIDRLDSRPASMPECWSHTLQHQSTAASSIVQSVLLRTCPVENFQYVILKASSESAGACCELMACCQVAGMPEFRSHQQAQHVPVVFVMSGRWSSMPSCLGPWRAVAHPWPPLFGYWDYRANIQAD